jgi:hypothetical protein
MKQGGSVGWNALKELVDQVPDPKLQSDIHDFVLSQSQTLATLAPTFSSSSSSSSSSLRESSAGHFCGEEEFRASNESQRNSATTTTTETPDAPSPTPSSSSSSTLPIVDLRNIRTFKSGGYVLVDLALEVPPEMTVEEMTNVESELGKRIREKFDQVGEVVCRFKPAHSDHDDHEHEHEHEHHHASPEDRRSR